MKKAGTMSLKPILSSAILLIALSTPLSSETGDGDETLSAYQALQQYGFPAGILPKGVTRYELDRETGEFRAYLNETCSFDLEGSYSLKYQPTITGVVSRGRIGELRGVSVKVLFFWLDIVEVVRSGDQLQFSVGILSASFPIENFAVCPQCGCGLVCGAGRPVMELLMG